MQAQRRALPRGRRVGQALFAPAARLKPRLRPKGVAGVQSLHHRVRFVGRHLGSARHPACLRRPRHKGHKVVDQPEHARVALEHYGAHVMRCTAVGQPLQLRGVPARVIDTNGRAAAGVSEGLHAARRAARTLGRRGGAEARCRCARRAELTGAGAPRAPGAAGARELCRRAADTRVVTRVGRPAAGSARRRERAARALMARASVGAVCARGAGVARRRAGGGYGAVRARRAPARARARVRACAALRAPACACSAGAAWVAGAAARRAGARVLASWTPRAARRARARVAASRTIAAVSGARARHVRPCRAARALVVAIVIGAPAALRAAGRPGG